VEAKIAFGRKLWQKTLIPDPFKRLSHLAWAKFNNPMHAFIVSLKNLLTTSSVL
jgi:hypothetical protein